MVKYELHLETIIYYIIKYIFVKIKIFLTEIKGNECIHINSTCYDIRKELSRLAYIFSGEKKEKEQRLIRGCRADHIHVNIPQAAQRLPHLDRKGFICLPTCLPCTCVRRFSRLCFARFGKP